MNKKQILRHEKRFQDKRVVCKEPLRFITDLDTLLKYFNDNLNGLSDKKILNIGCGTGSLTTKLAEKNKVLQNLINQPLIFVAYCTTTRPRCPVPPVPKNLAKWLLPMSSRQRSRWCQDKQTYDIRLLKDTGHSKDMTAGI